MIEPGHGRGLVLVIEDEPAIADVIRRYLVSDGFTAHLVRTGADGLGALRRERPVAIVLDIGLPDVDGLTLCRELRAAGDWTPVVFVTARDEDVDRIVGLEAGADDYLVKPFHPRELLARLRSVLRRAGPSPVGTAEVLTNGRLRVDVRSRRVHLDPDPSSVASSAASTTVEPTEIALTATEFDLLVHLMRRPGQVFERPSLLSSVWGYAATSGARTVDVHIAALRAKLGAASPIRTVRGVGYAAEVLPSRPADLPAG